MSLPRNAHAPQQTATPNFFFHVDPDVHASLLVEGLELKEREKRERERERRPELSENVGAIRDGGRLCHFQGRGSQSRCPASSLT